MCLYIVVVEREEASSFCACGGFLIGGQVGSWQGMLEVDKALQVLGSDLGAMYHGTCTTLQLVGLTKLLKVVSQTLMVVYGIDRGSLGCLVEECECSCQVGWYDTCSKVNLGQLPSL